MTSPGGGPSTSRLRRLAQHQWLGRADEERCEVCSAPLPPQHRHLLDIEARSLLCVCRACTLLFDRGAAGGGHFRLVPSRRVRLEGFALDDLLWASLGIPVDLAFFFHSTAVGRISAFYPSPMGVTEASVEPDAWQQVEAVNPVLAEMEPDVEALVVNRTKGAREHWLVPVDDCYRLAAVVRTHWKGFNGGQEVRNQLREFFEQLKDKTRT
jgi:hypothetical protein